MSYRNKSLVWIASIFVLFILAVGWHGHLSIRAVAPLLALCFACELIDSGLGMGYGTILTPVLLLIGYQPADIVPTILCSELLSGVTAAFFHHQIKNVDLRPQGRDWKPAILLAGGSLGGAAVGVFLSLSLPADAIKLVIGWIIMFAGLFVVLLSRRVIQYRHWKMLLLATIASFNKAISGGGYGPLVTSGQILTGVRGKSAVGITSFAEAFTCLAAITFFLSAGGYINLQVLIPMCAGALISVPFSVFAVNKASEDHLKMVIGVLTMAMGALTVFRGLS